MEPDSVVELLRFLGVDDAEAFAAELRKRRSDEVARATRERQWEELLKRIENFRQAERSGTREDALDRMRVTIGGRLAQLLAPGAEF